MQKNKAHLLFICSKNKWRSLTAEHLYKNDLRFEIRSGGVSDNANHIVSTKDIAWATLIVCMEPKHKDRIAVQFRGMTLPKIVVWDIPDEYHYMDHELVLTLQEKVEELGL